MPWRSLVTLIAVVGVAVDAAATAGAGTATLVAKVGPTTTISLTTTAGKPVTTLKPGIYTIVVRDRSRQLNFHLVGPTNSLSRATTLRFVGATKWRLKLVPGKYRYFSDRQKALLTKSFRVR